MDCGRVNNDIVSAVLFAPTCNPPRPAVTVRAASKDARQVWSRSTRGLRCLLVPLNGCREDQRAIETGHKLLFDCDLHRGEISCGCIVDAAPPRSLASPAVHDR